MHKSRFLSSYQCCVYFVFYISLGKDINYFLIGLYKGIFALNFFHQDRVRVYRNCDFWWWARQTLNRYCICPYWGFLNGYVFFSYLIRNEKNVDILEILKQIFKGQTRWDHAQILLMLEWKNQNVWFILDYKYAQTHWKNFNLLNETWSTSAFKHYTYTHRMLKLKKFVTFLWTRLALCVYDWSSCWMVSWPLMVSWQIGKIGTNTSHQTNSQMDFWHT